MVYLLQTEVNTNRSGVPIMWLCPLLFCQILVKRLLKNNYTKYVNHHKVSTIQDCFWMFIWICAYLECMCFWIPTYFCAACILWFGTHFTTYRDHPWSWLSDFITMHTKNSYEKSNTDGSSAPEASCCKLQQQSANAAGADTFYSFGHQCPGNGIQPSALPPFCYHSSPTSRLSPSCY